MTDNVSHLPAPGVVLDLDTLERDPKDVKPPFVVNVAGKALTFADPSDLEWQDLAAVQVPQDLLRVAMSREDRHHLAEAKLPSWKFNKLMEGYYNHYDLESKIENARRQAQLGGL